MFVDIIWGLGITHQVYLTLMTRWSTRFGWKRVDLSLCLVISLSLGIPIDSGMDLSIRIDKLRVFISKTLSTQSLINHVLIKRVGLSSVDSR
jgi:hypothetical protein